MRDEFYSVPHGYPPIAGLTKGRRGGRIVLVAEVAHLEDFPLVSALVHESELARNEPDSQVHHLPRAYDDGLPSSAIRLRM